jgi:hypothetical protein
MNIRKHVFNYLNKGNLNEGFTDEGRPDTKYYAFDWDDNILFMPTSIILLSDKDDEVPMSTEDFAEHRQQIGKEPFNYKGTAIVDFAPNPFRNFRSEGDKRFVLDSLLAQPGPSWNDFVECINGGSIFAIITARGHNPKTLREAVYNLIMSNHLGINSKTLSRNLKRYRHLGGDVDVDGKTVSTLTKNELNEYLNLCRFEPVTFGDGDASNPEEGKIKAMRNFIGYCKEMAQEIGEKAFFKNDIVNNEIEPIIGFSDDDERNIEKMKGFLEKEYEKNPVKTYLTKGGNKKEV